MKKANADVYFDKHHPKKSGLCAVKIKVTFNRKRKYYPTGIDLTSNEFKKIMYGKRRNREQREVHTKLNAYLVKAENTIKDLKVFTFPKFEEQYTESRDVNNDVSYAFDKRINELKENGKIGTAITYECARNNLYKTYPKLTFAEVTPSLLLKYENQMINKGQSITTVSMYLRCLRAIFNRQTIDPSIYPFGRGKGKYTIPTGRNFKKALTMKEVADIFNYEPENDAEAMARDYWVFLYLCNGMNVKDLCLLKWENIKDDILIYVRSKTSSTKKETDPIRVRLHPETKAIIKKWGIQSIDRTNFVFPHLEAGMTPERQRKIYQQLTKTINKYIQRIADKVGIKEHVTTYSARHSFATILKRSGSSTEMISELLGHSSVNVTKNYLDSFEDEQIKKETEVLVTGFHKKAN